MYMVATTLAILSHDVNCDVIRYTAVLTPGGALWLSRSEFNGRINAKDRLKMTVNSCVG